MKTILNELIEYRSLDKSTAKKVLMDMASGAYNSSQMSAFITVYMMRTITIEELEGFRDAMLELCIPVTTNKPLIDVCGTGGDGKNTFNISTLSAFVVAAAGQPVAKHGNYGVSSVSGSSNVMEHLGYTFSNDTKKLMEELERTNIFFMHAPLFHPAMKNVAPIRKELGVKTFFNLLGPIVNPASPPRQLVGVFNLELARQYGYLYQQSNKDYVILHDLNGYDEISLTGPFKIFSNWGEDQLEPSDLGLPEIKAEDLQGGETVEEAADIFLNILQGKGTDAQKAAVVANAGMALYCGNKKEGLIPAVQKASKTLSSGEAYHTFKKLINS